MKQYLLLTVLAMAVLSATAFTPMSMPSSQLKSRMNNNNDSLKRVILRMSEEPKAEAVATEEEEEEEEFMDTASRLQLEKQKKADLLRSQEVFMKRSTGKHECSVCSWTYDETKGDSFIIGGMAQPGTTFDELASNWRCPTCRASKDKFIEITEEIPGFEVNQGYGFGTNSMTASQKNLLIFGGLGLFFVLFLSGYAMS
jgi:rubredoxin